MVRVLEVPEPEQANAPSNPLIQGSSFVVGLIAPCARGRPGP